MNILLYFETKVARANGGRGWGNGPQNVEYLYFYRDNPDRRNRILGFRPCWSIR